MIVETGPRARTPHVITRSIETVLAEIDHDVDQAGFGFEVAGCEVAVRADGGSEVAAETFVGARSIG
ncbi:hypothetical protein [Nocardia beijingensis]|uniref:hypothetical protein n=1 Tax=Nocardia beijingensis TaxID=95162 RepID=UPI0033AC7AE0